jgi:hypothetical protein
MDKKIVELSPEEAVDVFVKAWRSVSAPRKALTSLFQAPFALGVIRELAMAARHE